MKLSTKELNDVAFYLLSLSNVVILKQERGSVVEGGAGCRVHHVSSVLGSVSPQTNQALLPSEIGEFVPDLFGKDKTLTCLSTGHPRSSQSLYRPNILALKLPP